MHLRPATLALLGLAAFTLSGCNSFGERASFNPRVKLEQRNDGLSLTDQGRVHLYANRTGLAVEAFRNALAQGEDKGPAYNGLGVAFARLGRPDLAETFFQRAVTYSPDNVHFAANLDRLTRSQAAVVMARHTKTNTPSTPADPSATSALAGAANATKASPMQRISRGEVRIATKATQPQPERSIRLAATVTTTARQATMARLSRGEVRIETTPSARNTAPRYPIRVHFASAGGASKAAKATASAKAVTRTQSRTVFFPFSALGMTR